MSNILYETVDDKHKDATTASSERERGKEEDKGRKRKKKSCVTGEETQLSV